MISFFFVDEVMLLIVFKSSYYFQNVSDDVSRGVRSDLLSQGGEGSGTATPEDLRGVFLHDSWEEPLPGLAELLTDPSSGSTERSKTKSSTFSAERGGDLGDMAAKSKQRELLCDQGKYPSDAEPATPNERSLDSDQVVQRDSQPGAVPSPQPSGSYQGPEGQLWEEEQCPPSPIIGSRRARSVSVGSRGKSAEPRDVSSNPDEPWMDALFGSASGEFKIKINEFRREERQSGIECATCVVSGDVREFFAGSRWSGTVAYHAGESGEPGHSHITFPAPGTNKWRVLRWIGQRLGLTDRQLDALGRTYQVIRCITDWMVYLARYGVSAVVVHSPSHAAIKFGKRVLQYLVNCGGDVVDGALPQQCLPNLGDRNHSSAEGARNRRKRVAPSENEVDYINSLCDRYKVNSVGGFMKVINAEEFKTLYGMSTSFKDRVRTIIEYRATQRTMALHSQRFWETYYNEFLDELVHPMTENEVWISNLFRKNKVNLTQFLAWVEVISDRLLTKVNTLLLFGKTTSGKTLILDSLLKLREPTKLSAMNANSPFYLAQLLNSHVGVMEEITVSDANKDDFKKLLGGEPMHVGVKYQNSPEVLGRVPIFASTNNRLGGFLADGDRDALQSRTKTFELNLEVRSRGDREANWCIPEPPGIITAEDWWGLYKRHAKAINAELKHITGQFLAAMASGSINFPIRKKVLMLYDYETLFVTSSVKKYILVRHLIW